MFTLALEIKEDLAAWSNLATLHYYEGEYAKAAVAFERALALSDDASFKTWDYLGTAYKWSGQPEKAKEADRNAVDLALKVLDINPRDPDVLGSLATYYASLGVADSSHIFLEQLIDLSPTDPQQLSGIGEAYELLGDRAKAIEWTEEALKRGYALAEIVDHPGFADLLADPDFIPIIEKYQSQPSSEEPTDTPN